MKGIIMNLITKSKKHVLAFMLTCLLAYLPTRCLYGASWPLFRATSDRTGSLAEQADPKLTPLWNIQYGETSASSFRISGDIVSSPVVYKGIVYFGGRDNSVWALNALTGEQVWQYNTDDWVDATPCVSSNTVFVPGRDKYFYALDRLTGEVRKQIYTGSLDASSPVAYGRKVFFLSGNPEKKLYAFDMDLNTLSGYDIGHSGFSSPAVKNNLLFFGTNDGRFNCFDLSTYQMKWSTQTLGGIYYSSLAAGENAVYAVAGEDERKLFCLSQSDGSVIWRSADLSAKRISASSVGLGEDKVFVACSSGTALFLYAFPLTGSGVVSPYWSARIGIPHPSSVISSPAVLGGVVYVGSGDGNLYCIRASDGKYINPGDGSVSSSPVGYYLSYEGSVSSGIVSSPAVSDGMVFAATYDGQLWAFKASTITAISYPDNDEKVVVSADIQGTVANASFTDYKLEYGAGSNPSEWTTIKNGTSTVDAGTLGTWNAAGLADGTYSLRLTVNGSAGNRAVNRVAVDNPPQAPTGVKAEDTPFDAGGSLTISWTRSGDDGAGDNDVANYKVYKSTYDGGYAFLAQVAAGKTSYTDVACPAQTTYYYVITSVDASSESSYSASANAFSIVDGTELQPETGGTVKLTYNGVVTEVVVEPNTFSQKVWIGIRVPAEPPETGKPANSKDTNIVREFGITPADAVFSKAITIKIPYRPQEISGMNKENLRIYWYDSAKNAWRIVNTSDPSSEDGRVWAAIPHFSLYRIMEYSPGLEELLQEDKTYTYPNPAKTDKLYFKFYLGSKADVTVDVYNVAGELIAHLEKTGCPAGIVSEIEWEIGSIASGVYVYRVEANAGGTKKALKKKLAIIH